MLLEDVTRGVLLDEVLSRTDWASYSFLEMMAWQKATTARLAYAALLGKEPWLAERKSMTTPVAGYKALQLDPARSIHCWKSAGLVAEPAADHASWPRRRVFAPQIPLLQGLVPPLMKENLTYWARGSRCERWQRYLRSSGRTKSKLCSVGGGAEQGSKC